MCEVMEQYLQKDHIEKIQKMLKKGWAKEMILEVYSEEEYEEAEKEILVNC